MLRLLQLQPISMSTRLILAASVASCIFVSSCASIVSKNSYPVSLQSTPSEAHFTVHNSNGQIIHQGKTPSTVDLKASAGYFKPASYTIIYKKKGYPTRTQQITATMDGWYIGNILFGGLIGLVIVDPATGNMWTMDKEHMIHLQDATTAGLVIKSLDSVRNKDRKHLKPIS